MKRWIIFFLVFFAAGIFIFELIQRDAGYVLISLNGTTLETSFWFAISVIVLLVLLIISVFLTVRKLIRTLVMGQNWFCGRRHQTIERRYREGLLNFLVGDYRQANKQLLSVSKRNELPVVRVIASAQSLAKTGQLDSALTLLTQAKEKYVDDELWLCKAKIPLLIEAGRISEVDHAIQSLKLISPKDTDIARFEHMKLSRSEHWQDASTFVSEKPNLQKLSSSDIKDTYIHALDQLAQNETVDIDDISTLWGKVPKVMKLDAELIVPYARLLFASNQHALLEELICFTLQKQWLLELLELYAKLESSDHDLQLKKAERWLKKHDEDKELLLTLGILSIKNQLWGKGRAYLDRSNRVGEDPRALYFLGYISEKVEEPESAQSYYKRAAELTHNQ